ncbi:nitroreductase family protein [Desulforamulus aeronauticus]|uniref:Nitroreductase n=1 Tax=Desulforamulus aeronauticus DSM 10349 TaxID=1121421 RepID=A0A1M6WZE9_9FIRM|nr:nitroreductase family protein [Desulforamulus aeronauticus]SHK99098.1 Nitroreductase [Desulforamulus aeronauticus DSM 10349]
MNNFLELASSRRSIRKFEDTIVPAEDVEYFIKAAVNAPSGCNSQCWRFVAIRDRDIMERIEEAVIKKLEQILEFNKKELTESYLASKRKMVSFFAKAPLVIAVFMTNANYYDKVLIASLKEQGYDDEGIMKLLGNFDILSVGAAIQNMLLAIHEKGYGACWMNDPAIAGLEINEILGIPPEQKFISLIPVGVPAYTPKSKKMKEMSEVFSII